MHITIRAFGIAADIVGARSIVVHLPQPATVTTLRQHLMATYPALGGLRSLAIALNGEYASDEAIAEDDEIALIPPVSGG